MMSAAMLQQIALAEKWAAEQQQVNLNAIFDALDTVPEVATWDTTLNSERKMFTMPEDDGSDTSWMSQLNDSGYGDGGVM